MKSKIASNKALTGLFLQLFITFLTLFTQFTQSVARDEVVRTTENGVVIGRYRFHNELGSMRFLGIPFAAPPVGNNRFRPPQPAANYSGGELEAFKFQNECIQGTNIGTQGSEDCLYLNIYAPYDAQSGDRKPVMFWIHGGGNENGNSHMSLESNTRVMTIPGVDTPLIDYIRFPLVDTNVYDGHYLAGKRDVILVTIQYRLNTFGHLYHDSLGEGKGNFAFLDMVMALQWVQRNIGNFGGDPGNVMVFGESAGGWDTCAMMFMPAARGLFHRAAIQSGACRGRTIPHAEDAAQETIQGTRCENVADVGRCLRELPAEKLFSPSVNQAFVPTVNTVEFPEFFPEALRNGNFHEVPLILGNNRDEFILPSVTDGEFNCLTEAMVDIFNREGYSAPIYKYRFDHMPLMFTPALHSVEMPYVFGTARDMFDGNRYDMDVANDMTRYWTDFARTGTPNGVRGSKTAWPQTNPSSPENRYLFGTARNMFRGNRYDTNGANDMTRSWANFAGGGTPISVQRERGWRQSNTSPENSYLEFHTFLAVEQGSLIINERNCRRDADAPQIRYW